MPESTLSSLITAVCDTRRTLADMPWKAAARLIDAVQDGVQIAGRFGQASALRAIPSDYQDGDGGTMHRVAAQGLAKTM